MHHSIRVKSILNKTKRRDPWFLDEYTINAYSGCSFNCLYCYIRGSKYGEHAEMKTSFKENALEILEKQLSRRARLNQYGIIVISSATDPYLQMEEDLKITRAILERILYYRFPIHIITKSDLVLRDLDLIKAIDQQAILPLDLESALTHRAFVSFSFSTLDDQIASIFEPGATAPTKRMVALEKMIAQNIRTGVCLMPLLPFITDNGEQLDHMYSEFSRIGTNYLFPASISLFGSGKTDSKPLVLRAVEKYYPQHLSRYQKWFAGTQTRMPAYYHTALKQKTRLLGEKYGLPDHLY